MTLPVAVPPPSAFLARALSVVRDPVATFRLHPADGAHVAEGERVAAGQPIAERCRETVLLEVPARGELLDLAPGAAIDPAFLAGGFLNRTPVQPGDRARLLDVGPDGTARVALGRAPEVVLSPIAGVVTEVGPGRIVVHAEGTGLAGRIGWGEPVHGRIVLGVPSPDAELRAAAIDIAAAGSILVAGARVDIEALTRARAIGVAGIVCGGIVGRELAQLAGSDLRQRAALNVAAPFALIALDGYGRRIVPEPVWERLAAAEGSVAGLLPDAKLIVLAPDAPAPPTPADTAGMALLTAGESAGRVVRLVGLAGPVRMGAAGYQPAGFIEEASPDGEVRRRIVPLADLERLG